MGGGNFIKNKIKENCLNSFNNLWIGKITINRIKDLIKIILIKILNKTKILKMDNYWLLKDSLN